jgi:hypothetical protein
MPRAAQINRLGAPAWPSTEITLAVQIGGSGALTISVVVYGE